MSGSGPGAKRIGAVLYFSATVGNNSEMNRDMFEDGDIAEQLSGLPFVTYLDDIQLCDGLCSGSISGAVVVACPDMGARLPFVCSVMTAPLLVIQTFGLSGIESDFEQINANFDFSDVIFYGHSDCRWMFPFDGLEVSDALKEPFAHQCISSAAKEASSLTLARRSVLCQMKQALSCSVVNGLAMNKKRFHAWFHNSSNNTLEVFDPSCGAFLSVNLGADSHIKPHFSGEVGRFA